MADKESTLAIVIRTVDQATAGIRAVNARIKGLTNGLAVLTAPAQLVGERLAALGKEAGIGKVIDGFKGVGEALGSTWGRIQAVGKVAKTVVGTLLGVAGVAGAAVLAVKSLVDEFDDLGDKSEKLGVTNDFLASMRYAAEKSGATMEQLDGGLTAFTENLGQARAGTGRMTAFLSKVSPALLSQLKATKSNEEAFRLLADAMAKVTDPAKRLALAQKTVGDSALAPLLARGAAGLLELQGAYSALAGSQETAAEGAGSVDDSMHDLKASTDGIKAAIISGLSPALKVLVDQLTEWFAGHREDVKQWAAQIGEKLPDAVHKVISTIEGAVKTVGDFVDNIGGLKVAAVLVAAVMVGPLLSAFVTLGVAMLTNPFGLILTAIGLLVLGGYELIKHWDSVSAFFGKIWGYIKIAFSAAWEFIKTAFLNFSPLGQIIKHWEPIKKFFSALWDGISGAFSTAWEFIKGIVAKIVDKVSWVIDKIKFLAKYTPIGIIAGIGDDSQPTISTDAINAAAGGGGRSTEAKVTVDFANAPKGTRVAADPQSTADVDLSVGYQMGAM